MTRSRSRLETMAILNAARNREDEKKANQWIAKLSPTATDQLHAWKQAGICAGKAAKLYEMVGLQEAPLQIRIHNGRTGPINN